MRIRHRSLLSVSLLVFALGAALTLPAPAYALWGALTKLGKAGSAAGKTAGTVGKGTAVGVAGAEGAAEVAGRGAAAGASFGDDAARTGFKAGAAEASMVNAALPPEVAAYLAKPARDLTPADTAAMMSNYQQMVLRASRSGDFTALERASSGTPTATSTAAHAHAPSQVRGAAQAATRNAPGLPFEAVRLLAHAANAGHRSAQQELDKVCTPGAQAANHLSAEIRYSKAFVDLCAGRKRHALAS